jgi:hypothetical protein
MPSSRRGQLTKMFAINLEAVYLLPFGGDGGTNGVSM